jgi:hypothetical protein
VARSSWLDLDIRGRTILAAAYLAVQAGFLVTSPLRPDGVFSFQMFNESSTIQINLGRRVATAGGERTVLTSGRWEAKDENGGRRSFAWNDRVADPILGTLGREVHASYGVEAQLYRLQRALDDVASHSVHDTETIALVADVQVRRNGRAPVVRHLESARRLP